MKTSFSLKGPGILPALIVGMLTGVTLLKGQAPDLARARQLQDAGHYAQAEQMYSQLTATNDEALLGRAVVRSWQGNYAGAEADYRAYLRKNPRELDSWIGYGFTLAWDKDYNQAERVFREVLQKVPGHEGARKGLAYLSLWQRKAGEAIVAFEALTQDFPGETEYRIALGQAYLLAGRQVAAREAFQSVLRQEPGHAQARQLHDAVRFQPAFLEVEGWGGYSQLEGEGHWGLRALSLAWQPQKDLRLWIRYDNSLSLDNLSLVQNRLQAPAWYGGGLIGWGRQAATRLELGRRMLPGQGVQVLLQGEQVWYFEKGFSMKAGASYGPVPEKGSDFLVYGGGRIPLTGALALEPHYFYSRSSLQRATEHRVLLNAQAQLPRGHRLLAGLMLGTVANENDDLSGKLGGGNLLWAFPLLHRHELQLLTRYEKGVLENFFTLAAGLKIRFER